MAERRTASIGSPLPVRVRDDLHRQEGAGIDWEDVGLDRARCLGRRLAGEEVRREVVVVSVSRLAGRAQVGADGAAST
jgi:hypothetical protein